MRPNRKKIVTAVVFAVTLVLGASALVLAWRLQQEKKITEEEASAASTRCNRERCTDIDGLHAADFFMCNMGLPTTIAGNQEWVEAGISSTDLKYRSSFTWLTPDQIGCSDTPPDHDPNERGFIPVVGYTDTVYGQLFSGGGLEKHWGFFNNVRAGFLANPPQGIVGDSRYWCTNIQADSGSGSFSLLWFGDNGEFCASSTDDGLNLREDGILRGPIYCTTGVTDVRGPSGNTPDGVVDYWDLDWDCTPEPLTIAGSTYCTDDGGVTKYPISGSDLAILYMDGPKVTSKFDINNQGTFSISTKTKSGTDKIYTTDGGFDINLGTLPAEGRLSTGQLYSSMIPANPKAANCASGVTTGCQGGVPAGNFCGGTGGTNYGWCGLGSGAHTGFDFVYTNCTPAAKSLDCISKTTNDSDNVVNPGDSIIYTINYESANMDSYIFVKDTLPTGLTFDSFINASGGDMQECGSGQTLNCCTFNGTTRAISCRMSPNLSGSVKYRANVNADVSGSITNNASVTNSDGTISDATGCTRVVTVNAPSARCEYKKAYDGATSTTKLVTIDPGQTVRFEIGYVNGAVASSTSRPLTITDTIPSAYENVRISPAVTGCTLTGNNLSCSLTNVAANATGKIILLAEAKSTIDRDTTITNTATISIAGDSNTTDDACSVGVSTSVAGVQCVSKSASAGYDDDTPVNPGDTLTYTINYTVERGPATVIITEDIPSHLEVVESSLPTGCELQDSDTVLYCEIVETTVGDYSHSISFEATVKTDIGIGGATLTNEIFVYEKGEDKPSTNPDSCDETVYVEHIEPACVITSPSAMTIRVADIAGTSVSLTTRGDLGTYSDLDFIWVASGGTLSNASWHASSGTPANGQVTDTVTWAPPAGAAENATFDIKVYVSPIGSSHSGYSNPANDPAAYTNDNCESTARITALDLICNWLVPNNQANFFPFDMTFSADIGGDQGAAFSYDLDFDDGTAHHTGNGTVASGTTVELPYIPSQSTPHTYDSTTPVDFAPVLTVTNTETGETSVCPTVLGGRTQSSWSIVKDSDVDTCTAVNTTVTYSIIVTNTGDYTADLAQVRDTVDSKIVTTTIANIKDCDANGQNCTSYNRDDVLTGRTITWPGRTYTARQSRKYMYTVSINTAGDYYNVAEAIPKTGAVVRDDEIFPTCSVAPDTGALSTTVYIAIFGILIVAGGYYVYKTEAGAQIVANVMGKTGRAVRRTVNRRETFERDAIKSEKDKLKS